MREAGDNVAGVLCVSAVTAAAQSCCSCAAHLLILNFLKLARLLIIPTTYQYQMQMLLYSPTYSYAVHAACMVIVGAAWRHGGCGACACAVVSFVDALYRYYRKKLR
eukprot:scaffold16367_cov124-Isochrysis_galbana.AAC.2